MTFEEEAERARAQLMERGYSAEAADAVALGLLEQLERLPVGQALKLGRLDEETVFARLEAVSPEQQADLLLGQGGTAADDFETAAGAERGRSLPHLVLDAGGLALVPGRAPRGAPLEPPPALLEGGGAEELEGHPPWLSSHAAEILAMNRRQAQLTEQAYKRSKAIEDAARALLAELDKAKVETFAGAVLREALKPTPEAS